MIVYVLLCYETFNSRFIGVFSSPEKAFEKMGYECPIDPDTFINVSYYLEKVEVD